MGVVRVWTVGGDVAELARLSILGGDVDGLGTDGPAERALVEWAVASGVDVAAAREAAPVASSVPWDAERRRVTTAHTDGEGVLVVCVGSPDAVWPLLVTSADGVSAGAVAARPVAEAWAGEGLYVLALATTRRTVAGNAAGRLEWGLRLLGLVALEGGPRSGAVQAVAGLRAAGLDVAVLSSDHEATAGALAAAVGIQARGRGAGIMTGEGMGTGRWADDVRVLARLSPDRHRDVVARWQAAGHVVALTGRSVPETPALRRANVGMCLGPADEGARAAADLVTDRPDLGGVLTAVTVARRALRGTRLMVAVPVVFLAAVLGLGLAGLAGHVWAWPGEVLALGIGLVAAPALVLLSKGHSPAPDVPGRPTGRVTDASWGFWVGAWAAGAIALALVTGGIAALLGVALADVAPAAVAGALISAGVVGAWGVGVAAADPRPARAAFAAPIVVAVLAAVLGGLARPAADLWWVGVVALAVGAAAAATLARRWPAP
jgi:Ca2+-transporting ATPase